jgi:flavin-dependent dehydrogenase
MLKVVVIGAGPAGSVAATLLAHGGLDVTIVESRAFPRMKVCGEYISPAATAILESLIPPDELLAAGARRVSRMELDFHGHRRCWDTPDAAWSLSRATLDRLLLQGASAAGASVLQPAAVRSVGYTDELATITLADGRVLESDLVVHADGSGRHDPAGPIPLAPNLLAHKCLLRLADESPDTVMMRVCPGAYIGTIGVEHGLHTCALVARRGLCRQFADVDAMVATLWPGFHSGLRASPWKSSGVARSCYVAPGHPRSIRLGNAAAAVDPVGGEGIGLALWAGAQLGAHANDFAALASSPACNQLTALCALERKLACAYTKRLRWRLPVCQLTGWALMRPAFVRTLWPLARVPKLTFAPFYRLTGKASPTIAAAPAPSSR